MDFDARCIGASNEWVKKMKLNNTAIQNHSIYPLSFPENIFSIKYAGFESKVMQPLHATRLLQIYNTIEDIELTGYKLKKQS